jgi:hypothetical protein
MRVKCPECGIPTIPDKEHLSHVEMLCEKCYEEYEEPEPDYPEHDMTGQDEPDHYPEPQWRRNEAGEFIGYE